MDRTTESRRNLTLQFSGESADEVLEFGTHATVRNGAMYPPDRVIPVHRLRLEVVDTGAVGYGRIVDVAFGVQMKHLLEDPRILQYERTPFRDPVKLWEFLGRVYPHTHHLTEWTIIVFNTNMVEV